MLVTLGTSRIKTEWVSLIPFQYVLVYTRNELKIENPD